MPSIDSRNLKFYFFKTLALVALGISKTLSWVSKVLDSVEIALITRASKYL